MNVPKLALVALIVAPMQTACSEYGPWTETTSYQVQNDGDYPVQVSSYRRGCDGRDGQTVAPRSVIEGKGEQSCNDYDDTTAVLELTIIGKVLKSHFSLNWTIYVPVVEAGAVFKLAVAPSIDAEATTADAEPQASFEVEPTTAVYYLGVPERLFAKGLNPPPGSYVEAGYVFLPYVRTDQHETKPFVLTNVDDVVCTSTICAARKEQP